MRKTLAVATLGIALTAVGVGTANAQTSDSQVVGNGTWYVISTDANTTGDPFSRDHDESQIGPVHHGREVLHLGDDRAIVVTSGSCKTVDPDGTVWGPLHASPGGTVTCYGASNGDN